MTVSSANRKAGPYLGNGVTTAFPFTFKVFKKEDVLVTFTDSNGADTELILDSDYSVSLNLNQNTNPGGTVTYPILGGDILPTGTKLTLTGDLAYTQPTDLPNLGPFFAETIEDAFDRSEIQIQQLKEITDRAIKISVSDSPLTPLPTAAARANTIIGFDALGNATVLPLPNSVGAGDRIPYSLIAGIDFTAGVSTQITLPRTPGSPGNLEINFDGVPQAFSEWSLSGATVTFITAIPAYTTKIWGYVGTTLSTQLPPDGSVTDAKIAAGSKLSNRLKIVYLDDYGGNGDGISDNSAAIIAADAVVGSGGVIICTGLNYYVGSSNLGNADRIYHLYNSVFSGPGAASLKGNMLTFPNYGISVGRSFDWRVAYGQGSSLTIGEYVAFQQDDPGAIATVRIFPGKPFASPTQVAIEPYFPTALTDLHAVGNGEDITSMLCGKATDPGGDGSEERGGWVFKNYFGATQYRHHQIVSFATITGTIRPIHVVLGSKSLAKFEHAAGKVSFDNSNVLGTSSQGNTVVDILNSPATENLRLFANAAGTVGISHLTAGVADTISTWSANGVSVATGTFSPYAAQGALDATTGDATRSAELLACTNAGYAGEVTKIAVSRAQNAAFSFWTARAAGNLTFNLRGDGNAFCDGSWTGGGADYAEFFEWADGNPNTDDRIGHTVVLDGAQIRLAVAGDVNIIGVVSANPTIVGDAGWNEWQHKYLTDDFGRVLTENVEFLEWEECLPEVTSYKNVRYDVADIGKDGKPSKTYLDTIEVDHNESSKTVQHAYFYDQIPPGVRVPDDVTRSIVKREILNPEYDPNTVYIPREQRKEWAVIGLLGKLRILNECPIDPRWIKLRTISTSVTEYLVR